MKVIIIRGVQNSRALSQGATPLPIPNRVVKPLSANDTQTLVCGKVGQRESPAPHFLYKKIPQADFARGINIFWPLIFGRFFP